ncbi:FGGY-family carbohydrate kinase, partial [Bifidobacterium longum]|nr:FGGY-family carbohydrate kinase [Bifidobacterium longum]
LNIILESFRKSIPIDELLVVGGGAKGALWCQMMADVYNARIKVPVLLEEATSMGAAVTGGVGVGVFKGFEVIDQMLELNRTVEPNPEAVAAYGPVKEAFEVCYKAMLPVYEYMASHKNGHCKVNMKKLGPEISQYRYATSRNSRLRFLDSLSPAHCAGVRLFKAE